MGRQQTIMRRILEEHLFQTHSGDQHSSVKSKAASSLDDADWLFRFTSDSKSSAQPGLDYTEGILRLPASPLFEYPKLVVWKQVDKLNEHFRKGGGIIEEVTTRPDEVLAILNFLLPGGQLLF